MLVLGQFSLYANTLKKTNSDGSNEYIVYGKQDHLYEFKHFIEKPGKMLELISSSHFNQEKDFKQKIKSFKSFRIFQKSKQDQSETLHTELLNNYVWRHTEQWSEEWENKYAKWINEEVDFDFFKKHNIQTDCADALYSLRWIFARINALPVANRVEATGRFLTNYSMKSSWRNLPRSRNWFEDRRFLAALNHLMDTTSTRTISADSYPLEISKDSLKPGALFLLDGHSKIAYRSPWGGASEPLNLLNSTVPRMVRNLKRGVFSNGKPSNGRGFRQFRWPYITSQNRWALKQGSSMKYYSEEQYQDDFGSPGNSFSLNVHQRIFGDVEALIRGSFAGSIDTLKNNLIERVRIVEDGFLVCEANECETTSMEYDNWSTFSRDKRLMKLVKTIFSDKKNLSKFFSTIVNEVWNEKFRRSSLEIEGREISLLKLINILSHEEFSRDPRDSILKRWGLDKFIEVGGRYIEKVEAVEKKSYAAHELFAEYYYELDQNTKVRFQTFGENEDECFVDSVITIRSLDGQLVFVNDDGGVSTCSLLIRDLRAGEYLFSIKSYKETNRIQGNFKIIENEI